MKVKDITVLSDIEFGIISPCALMITLRMLPYHYMSFVQEYAYLMMWFTVCWLVPAAIILVIVRWLGVRTREKGAVLGAIGGAVFSPLFLYILYLGIIAYSKDKEFAMLLLSIVGKFWGCVLLSCGAYLLVMRWLRKHRIVIES